MPPQIDTKLDVQTRRLLWTSFGLTFIIIILGLAPFLGVMSLWTSPAMAVATLIYTITLLVLTSRERKELTRPKGFRDFETGHAVRESKLGVGLSNTAYDASASTTLIDKATLPVTQGTQYDLAYIPHRYRLPSIIVSFVLAVFWLGPVAVLLVYATYVLSDRLEQPKEVQPWGIVPVVEAIVILAQIGVMVAYGVKCVQRRKTLIA